MLLDCYQWQPMQMAFVILWVAMEMLRMCNGSNVNRTLSNRLIPCPSGCNCSDSQVDCQGLNLSTVPISLPSSTSSLRMSNNKMRRLGNDSLIALTEVQKLYLDHNHIHTIEEGTFQYTTKLEVLHLQGNSLSLLQQRLFAGLYHLRHLYLHGNALSTLHPQLFSDTPHLHILDLRANRLSDLSHSPFQNVAQLNRLHLAQNPLRTLPNSLFDNQGHLKELTLGQTQLSSVQPKLLQPLKRLNKLSLDRNRLVNIRVDSLDFLHNLQYLNLSGNPFRCDCKMLRFFTWITNKAQLEWDEYSTPKCNSPHKLKNQVVFRLSAENFTCPRRPPRKQWTYYTYRHTDVVNPAPLPYDRMMGWYTAATLSTMLVLFLIGVALDAAKRKFFRWRRAKREEREERERLENQPPVELKNCKPKLVPTNSLNSNKSSREIPVPDTLNFMSRQGSFMSRQGSFMSRQGSFMSRQSSCEGARSNPADILKRNDLMPARTPLPKVEIHLAPNLHDFANFHNPQDYLKSQDILIDVTDNIEKNDSKFLLWPANAKLNKLQKQVETSL